MKYFIKIILGVLFTGIYISSSAQERCGNERLMEYISENQNNQRAFNESNILINNTLNSQRGEDEILVIPIVVHVLHLGEPVGTGSNISDQQIYDAVRGANERWRRITGNGVDMQVEFCLAQYDPDGNPTNGIDRIDARIVPDYEEFGISYLGARGGDELRLKNLSNWPHTFVYNIWIVHEITGNWAGFALFPYTFQYSGDGSVVKSNYMTYNSSTLAHELGHGMALFHTFQGDDNGCPYNTNCTIQGDWVCDTPPHKQSDCSNTPCSDSDSLQLSLKNYMSYCGSKTLFTQGQKDRSRTAITTLSRKRLLTSTACSGNCVTYRETIEINTCDAEQAGTQIDSLKTSKGCDSIITTQTTLILPPAADFSYSIGDDGSVSFTNTSQNHTSSTWDFGDGNVSEESNPIHTYTEEGNYAVSVMVTNDCGNDFVTENIQITLTGVKGNHSVLPINIYPNPTKNDFFIDLPPSIDQIKILNTVGQVVLDQQIHSHNGQISIKGFLTTGLYFVAYYHHNERLFISKLLIH